MKLMHAGYDAEVILARLEKQGIPEDLARRVIANLSIERKKEVIKEQTPFYYIALFRIGLGVFFALGSIILIPGLIILPVGLIAGGIIYAMMAKSKMKG